MENSHSVNNEIQPKDDPKRKPRNISDPGWKYAFWPNIEKRDLVECILCGRQMTGGINRIKQHLAGGFGDITICPKTTTELRKEMLEYILSKKKKKVSLDFDDCGEEDNEDHVQEPDELHSSVGDCDFVKMPSSGTATKQKKKAVSMLDFVNLKPPFNAAHSLSYEIMIESVGQYGPGLKPPSYHELRVPLLEKAKKKTEELRVNHEKAWEKFGCTIMADGWTDRRQRHLINFLVNSPEGTFFLGFERRFPGLWWTPCAAHCINLMMEEIGGIKEFKKVIASARRITTFIYRHGRILDFMREKTGQRELVRPGATRFATAFLTLQCLYNFKDSLRLLFISGDWQKSQLSKTLNGQKVESFVLSVTFWNGVYDCIVASKPLLQALRIVDGDEMPAMS